jgi:aminoglycoside phosphotransferase (APT) family kinase protein
VDAIALSERTKAERAVKTTGSPTPELRAQLTSALGKEAVDWRRPHTGLSAAQRFVVRFGDGSSIFVKAAVDRQTERWLRTEREILTSVDRSFVPKLVAWVEEGERSVLVTEDLGAAYWPADRMPVAWQPGQLDRLFETLRRVGDVTAPPSLPPAELGFEPQWPRIAGEADDFLKLGLCPEDWFRHAIHDLSEAESRVPLRGDSLVHGDVRSDNLCFAGERMVLVDWAAAVRGSCEHDLATVLATLPLEGGPDPFEVLPGGGTWAAYYAGRTARRAYRDKGAPPWLRRVLRQIAAICLAWASRSLDLPRWSGIDWRAIR